MSRFHCSRCKRSNTGFPFCTYCIDKDKKRAVRVVGALGNRPEILREVRKLMFPQTLDDAVAYLLLTLSDEDMERMRAEKREDLIGYHHGFGRSIRNLFRLHYESKLVESCTGNKKDACGDDASMAIMEALWEKVVCDCSNPPIEPEVGTRKPWVQVSVYCPVHNESPLPRPEMKD